MRPYASYKPGPSVSSCCVLSTNAAVIEVTAGGEVSEPTYRFSDASGNALATLVGNSTALSASADLVTGNGNSVDELATAMASLQAILAQLNATVAQLDAQVTSLATRLELAEAAISTLQTALAAKLDLSAASSYLTSASAAAIYASETELFNVLARQHLSGRCHFHNSKHTCYQGCSSCNFCSNQGSQTFLNCAKLCAMTTNCRSFDYSGSTCMLVNHPNKPNDRGSSPDSGGTCYLMNLFYDRSEQIHPCAVC